MKIIVFGNIGSGKTTVCSLLHEHTGCKYVSIDQMRVKYSDGSYEGEAMAHKAFYEDVRISETQIVECLGVGKVTEQTYDILVSSSQQVVCLVLTTAKEVCLNRLKSRVWAVPFFLPINKVYSLVDKVDQHIRSGQIYAKWELRPNTLILLEDNSRAEDLTRIIQKVVLMVNFPESYG